MSRYPKVYLSEVVETQGKLFDFAASFPESDTEDFICCYMKSRTRKFVDDGQVYVSTMDVEDLWEFFCQVDGYSFKKGTPLGGFAPMWMGEFYAYYQWEYDLPSSVVVDRIPVSSLKISYLGLRDLDLELAVRKVGLV